MGIDLRLIKVHDLIHTDDVEYISLDGFYGVQKTSVRVQVGTKEEEIEKGFWKWKRKIKVKTPVYEIRKGSTIMYKDNREWSCKETPEEIFNLIDRHVN